MKPGAEAAQTDDDDDSGSAACSGGGVATNLMVTEESQRVWEGGVCGREVGGRWCCEYVDDDFAGSPKARQCNKTSPI